MNSIDRNQEENNHKDLTGPEAVEKLRDLASGTCFFCTRLATGASEGARPMSVLEVDEGGSLWFLSSSDSHKNEEIQADQTVDLYFQGSSHSDFLHLVGTVTVSRNADRIRELWQPMFKTWFTEGEDDPRVTVVQFTPSEGYYWDTKHGNFVAGMKIMIGAATGKTMDDSIQGKIDMR